MSLFPLLALSLSVPHVQAAKNPFRVEAPGVDAVVDKEAAVKVTVVVPKGFHVYRDMMYLKVLDGNGLTFSEAVFPQGVFQPDPADPEGLREQYDESVQISAAFTPSKPGTYAPLFEIRYQGCKASLCYMPKKEELIITVEVGAGSTDAGDQQK